MELLTIGAFARQARLSPKALRLYDGLGLLSPAAVDAESGYRYYHPAQLDRARLVSQLRKVGMPLARIGEVIDLPGWPGSPRTTATSSNSSARARSPPPRRRATRSARCSCGRSAPEARQTFRCVRRLRATAICSARTGCGAVVDDEQLRDALAAGGDPEQTVQRLVDLAYAAGAPDNIAVVVADAV